MTNDIIHNQIPKLKELMENGELNIRDIDVFCEKGIHLIIFILTDSNYNERCLLILQEYIPLNKAVRSC